MDNLSAERRSANMRAVKGRDTQPEMVVRRLAQGLGYRYRLHVAKLPGKPDMVFAKYRKAVFVHGCFWHHHKCKHGLQKPKTNRSFWTKKIAKNIERDVKNLRDLRTEGWRVLVVWECETRDETRLTKKLNGFLKTLTAS